MNVPHEHRQHRSHVRRRDFACLVCPHPQSSQSQVGYAPRERRGHEAFREITGGGVRRRVADCEPKIRVAADSAARWDRNRPASRRRFDSLLHRTPRSQGARPRPLASHAPGHVAQELRLRRFREDQVVAAIERLPAGRPSEGACVPHRAFVVGDDGLPTSIHPVAGVSRVRTRAKPTGRVGGRPAGAGAGHPVRGTRVGCDALSAARSRPARDPARGERPPGARRSARWRSRARRSAPARPRTHPPGPERTRTRHVPDSRI